jgi:hypothetical protein
MRLLYIAVAAVAALVASTDGLEVVPNSAVSTSLRASADVRRQPYVEGKSDRFLISEAGNADPTKAPTGYAFSTLQEEDSDVLQQEDDEFEDDSASSSADNSRDDERLFGRKKKKKRKKSKATETPTPTPTATPEGTATVTPTPTPPASTPTPAPTTQPPSRLQRFIAWIRRVFSD